MRDIAEGVALALIYLTVSFAAIVAAAVFR